MAILHQGILVLLNSQLLVKTRTSFENTDRDKVPPAVKYELQQADRIASIRGIQSEAAATFEKGPTTRQRQKHPERDFSTSCSGCFAVSTHALFYSSSISRLVNRYSILISVRMLRSMNSPSMVCTTGREARRDSSM